MALEPLEMQKRFHALGAEKDAIQSRSAPARSEREALQKQVAELELKIIPLNKVIQEIEKSLYDIDMERGMLARALNGKTGPKPA